MFSLQSKKISSQKMQNSTEEKTDENTNKNNHNNRIMQEKMISRKDVFTASFRKKHSKKTIIIK